MWAQGPELPVDLAELPLLAPAGTARVGIFAGDVIESFGCSYPDSAPLARPLLLQARGAVHHPLTWGPDVGLDRHDLATQRDLTDPSVARTFPRCR